MGFIVGKNGEVRNSKILHSVGGGGDDVALTAVRQLPRFIPGKQQGRPVAVSFTDVTHHFGALSGNCLFRNR